MFTQKSNKKNLIEILKIVLKVRLINNLLAYLDSQTLLSIIEAIDGKKIFKELANKFNIQQIQQINNQQQNQLVTAIKSYYYIKEHLNKTDKSMYFSFYQQGQFIQIQKSFSENLTQDNRYTFCNLFDHFHCIFQQILQNQILISSQSIELTRILVDPSLPLPKLKRQNQGIYCKSSFQLFLVDLQFKNINQEPSYFQDLKQKLKSKEQVFLKCFIQIFKQKNNSQQILKQSMRKIHQVRYTPYQISHLNYKNYLLAQNFLIHNFIVYLFALTQLFLQSIYSYIKTLDDPLLRFIQLIARYSIFRNFVIEIQENLSFAFQEYENLYSDIGRQSKSKAKYNFWRPAMTKWYTKMNQFHPELNLIYSFLIFKMRFQHIQSFIEQASMFKETLISTKNKMNQMELEYEMRKKIYKHQQSTIEQYCQNDHQSNYILINEYVQYLIDISINEQTVHWCGHSQHQLDTPYHNFQAFFMQSSREYFNCLKDTVKGKCEKQSAKLLNVIFQQQICFLQSNGLKPLTLKKLINYLNQQYISNLAVENEIIPVFLDFSFRDENLKYFNQKAKIDCCVNQEQKCFFSISPLLSPEQILIKSIDTNDSDRLSKDSDSYQYMSDNDNSQQFIQ